MVAVGLSGEFPVPITWNSKTFHDVISGEAKIVIGKEIEKNLEMACFIAENTILSIRPCSSSCEVVVVVSPPINEFNKIMEATSLGDKK